MKLKYYALVGDDFVNIFEHPHLGLVIVIPTQLQTSGTLIIHDCEKDIDLEGEQLEEIKQIIIDALPVFHELES